MLISCFWYNWKDRKKAKLISHCSSCPPSVLRKLSLANCHLHPDKVFKSPFSLCIWDLWDFTCEFSVLIEVFLPEIPVLLPSSASSLLRECECYLHTNGLVFSIIFYLWEGQNLQKPFVAASCTLSKNEASQELCEALLFFQQFWVNWTPPLVLTLE